MTDEDRVGFWSRLRVTLGLFANLRGQDLFTAAEFMKIAFPNQNRLIRLVKFTGWAFNIMWFKMPDGLKTVTIDRNVSKIPYWQTAANPLADYPWADDPSAALPTEADAVVIGSGFGGSSVAYHWSKHADGNLVLL